MYEMKGAVTWRGLHPAADGTGGMRMPVLQLPVSTKRKLLSLGRQSLWLRLPRTAQDGRRSLGDAVPSRVQ